MHPHSKHLSLFLTPRSPWGRLPVKRALQSHMRASEGKKPVPTIAGNNVPSSLQSQITPERTGEVMHPSPQHPLSAKPAPSLKDPLYQPPPPQTFPMPAGSGVLRPATTGQQMTRPVEAENAMGKAPQKQPFAEYMNGVNLGPLMIGVDGESVGNGGLGFKLTPKNIWKTPKK